MTRRIVSPLREKTENVLGRPFSNMDTESETKNSKRWKQTNTSPQGSAPYSLKSQSLLSQCILAENCYFADIRIFEVVLRKVEYQVMINQAFSVANRRSILFLA